MKSTVNTLIEQLKARNVRKTLTIYGSSALTVIGVIKLFTEAYDLPSKFFSIVVTVLSVGVASAFVYAWNRNALSVPRKRKTEISLHTSFALVALLLSYRIATSDRPVILLQETNAIAVLPFVNLSDNKEDEYFSDGITEDILTQLSKIGDLRVISRTSIMQYKGTTKPLKEIGKELGVGTILEGSVRRVGSRVRIVGQLINGQTDEHIWAETYDRDMADVFAIQSDVAHRIAAALKATLSPEEEARINTAPTGNIEAYGYYLRGREYYYQFTEADNERAIELFQKAIQLDGRYALAYAGIADAYAQRVQRFGYESFWADSAIAVAMTALRMIPDIAEPYKALGLSYTQRGWNAKAVAQYRRAVEINPNFAPAIANLGLTLSWMGKQDEAIMWVKKSIALTPGRASYYHTLGGLYRTLEEDTLSEQALRKAIELQPSYIYTYGGLSQLYIMQGDFNRALALMDTILSGHPDDPFLLTAAGDVHLLDGGFAEAADLYARAIANSSIESGPSTQLGYVLIKTGRAKEGEDLLNKSVEINMISLNENNEDSEAPYNLARISAIRSDLPAANRWLQLAIERGWQYHRWCLRDPLLENLRSNPAFLRTMGDLKKKLADMRTQVRNAEEDIHIPL